MARTLTVSRVSVRPDAEPDYLATVRELAELAQDRGWHLWVFRSAGEPGLFLEFIESRSAESHPALAERPPDERRLEARLRMLGTRDAGASDLWEEVRN
ncbi:MAG: hypothetical protein ABI766_11950 [Gemmatimonadales bacterium]